MPVGSSPSSVKKLKNDLVRGAVFLSRDDEKATAH
jgi:hypothetical protein